MAEVKYGELASWDDGDVSGPNDFMNLVEGDNKVRVVTNPYQFVVHWFKDASDQNRKIRCALEGCPLCKQGVAPQTRWFIGVLDRKSGKPKVLEISSQIYKQIRSYNSDPDWSDKYEKPWGEIFAYDFNINRGPKGTQPLYQVKASPKMKDLTEEETFLVESFLERVDIAKFTKPPTPEEVAEKAGVSVSGGNGSSKRSGSGKSKTSVKPTISDDEFEFGDEL